MQGGDACGFGILNKTDVYMCINATPCLSKVAPEAVVKILLFVG